MRCQLLTTETPGVLRCPTCGRTIASEHAPEQTYRTCRQPGRKSAEVVLFPCIHRGTKIGSTPCEIPSCQSRITVYSCTLLQECTLSHNVPSKPYCGDCDRREPTPK